MTEPAAPTDLREELSSLAASARALLEQYEDSGAIGLACDPAIASAFLSGAPLPSPRPMSAPQPMEHAPEPAAHAPQARFVPPEQPRFVPPEQPRFAPEQPRPAPPPRAERSPLPPEAPPARDEMARARAPQKAPPQEVAPARAAAPQSGQEGDDRRMRLALLNEEQVRGCTKCPLCETRTQTVFARGNPFAELMFVGEGPGADEDAQGEPFVGAAGKLLDKMIAAMGYHRDEVYIANIVKCRPPSNRKPEPAEMEACMPYLREQLVQVKPKVIVALGATAVTGLIGTTEGITRLRGKWKLYKGVTPVMPTFHPAYLLRDPSKKRDAWSDLQEVMKHLGKAPPRPDPRDRGGA